jgi:hypothetical protein
MVLRKCRVVENKTFNWGWVSLTVFKDQILFYYKDNFGYNIQDPVKPTLFYPILSIYFNNFIDIDEDRDKKLSYLLTH